MILSEEENKGKIAYFGGINKARFRNKVVPGTMLRMELELVRRKGPVGVGIGKAYRWGPADGRR